MKKAFAAVLVLSLLCVAEESMNQPPHQKYTIGLAAGMVGGYGLSFQRWSKNNWGAQFNLLPFYYEEKYSEDEDRWSRKDGYSKSGKLVSGLLLFKTISEIRMTRIVLFGGSSLDFDYLNEHYLGHNYSTYTDEWVNNYKTSYDISAGGGIGGIYREWKLSFSVLLGIVGAYNITHDLKRLWPSIDVGVHFHL